MCCPATKKINNPTTRGKNDESKKSINHLRSGRGSDVERQQHLRTRMAAVAVAAAADSAVAAVGGGGGGGGRRCGGGGGGGSVGGANFSNA